MDARKHLPTLATTAAVTAAVLLGAACSLFGTHEKRAVARLKPASGYTARGVVTLIERTDGVQVSYNLTGLSAEHNHALRVRETGDCARIEAAPGDDEVFNPDNVVSSDFRDAKQPAGRLPAVHADANGVATGFVVTSQMAPDGVRSVLGRAIVIHRGADDPPGATEDLGPVIACGTIGG